MKYFSVTHLPETAVGVCHTKVCITQFSHVINSEASEGHVSSTKRSILHMYVRTWAYFG